MESAAIFYCVWGGGLLMATWHGTQSPPPGGSGVPLRGGNHLHGSKDFRTEDGSSQGQILALTGLFVPRSKALQTDAVVPENAVVQQELKSVPRTCTSSSVGIRAHNLCLSHRAQEPYMPTAQGYLAQKKRPTPQDHHRALGIGVLQGPGGWRFLLSEVHL